MAGLHLPFIGHGGDYNPDQWRDTPEVLREDVRLMKLAGCNLMSMGIFSWAALEPREGEFDFQWLGDVLDRLYENGISVFLATPSGARPAWMSQKYPEVLRVGEDGLRNFHGGRHNHCYTSPIYRRLTQRINRALAERFGHHPAVVGWHISNELGGECHCELCQRAFRDFLKARYGSLEALNRAWWTGFWSKTYTDWEQLRGPSSRGEQSVHGLNLSWRRFVTDRTIDFLRCEVEPIRQLTPDLPITTNLMEMFEGLDYELLAKELDFTSFDSYPRWGGPDEEATALFASFNYDWMRSLKRQPFALMESTPSQVNWHDVCKLKKPGMHALSCLQAVAHGADTVQYFQWRKSRGAVEKFHGAVVDHVGHEHTRTFREVQEVGRLLKALDGVRGKMPEARVALIFDTQNRWALEDCQGPLKDLKYMQTVMEHYRALKRLGVAVDILDQTRDLSAYRLVVAPMLYMLRPGAAERLTDFVDGGGTLVCTCYTGRVDQDDLCFLGGFPGPLTQALGIWIEETDALYPQERNGIVLEDGASYSCSTMCDLIHTQTARTVGRYAEDFYAGEPCVTVNAFGAGQAWYIATRPDADFLDAFYARLAVRAGISGPVAGLPVGVQAAVRGNTLFVMNFNGEKKAVRLPTGRDALTGEEAGDSVVLPPLGYKILDME